MIEDDIAKTMHYLYVLRSLGVWNRNAYIIYGRAYDFADRQRVRSMIDDSLTVNYLRALRDLRLWTDSIVYNNVYHFTDRQRERTP